MLDGVNIPVIAADTDVRFYYSHDSHWITDSVNSRIVSPPGNHQAAIGCHADRGRIVCAPGSGTSTETASIPSRPLRPAGSYEAKTAIDESWDENYGAGGVPDGATIPFVVEADGDTVTFTFESASNLLTIDVTSSSNTVALVGSLQSEIGCARGLGSRVCRVGTGVRRRRRRVAGHVRSPDLRLGVRGRPQRLEGVRRLEHPHHVPDAAIIHFHGRCIRASRDKPDSNLLAVEVGVRRTASWTGGASP